MSTYTPEEAAALLAQLAVESGLEVVYSEVFEGDFGWEAPISNLFVTADAGYEAVSARMASFEKDASRRLGGDFRTGLYYAEIGYDDVPAGQALIQIDCLPITITPLHSARP